LRGHRKELLVIRGGVQTFAQPVWRDSDELVLDVGDEQFRGARGVESDIACRTLLGDLAAAGFEVSCCANCTHFVYAGMGVDTGSSTVIPMAPGTDWSGIGSVGRLTNEDCTVDGTGYRSSYRREQGAESRSRMHDGPGACAGAVAVRAVRSATRRHPRRRPHRPARPRPPRPRLPPRRPAPPGRRPSRNRSDRGSPA